MKFCFRLFRRVSGQQKANGLSASIAGTAMLFLHLESSPTPAGSDVARRLTNKQPFVMMAQKPEVPPQSTTVVATQETLTPEQRTEKELLGKIQLIEKGVEFLAKTPDYTAQFVKQELVNGSLLDEQEMEMKVRHSPFSVYLKWTTGEAGREILYVDGENDGRLTAHAGGWKARLPAVSLDPNGTIALSESRYPVTKVGLFELSKMMIDVHRDDLKNGRVARCEKLDDQVFDGRPCHAYLVEYKDVKVSEQYRKSIALIDKEWSIPVYTRNFGWLTGDEPTDAEQLDQASLIEFYSYSNIKFRSNLVALDFDHTNEDYRFRRQ
jgi:hypothetical protein